MSRKPSPYSNQRKLNHLTPGSYDVRLGDIIADLVNQVNALQADVAAMQADINTGTLSNPSLVISAGGSAAVKASAAFAAICGGVIVKKPANTAMAALAGTLATGKSAAWAFFIDATGTITTSPKTADAVDSATALTSLTPPANGQAMIGFITIDNTSGANFVGGTTALDAAGIAVNYYGAIGPTAFSLALTSAQITPLESR